MAQLWNSSGVVVGNNDPTISPYKKTWISQNGIVVCGVTGEGTSKELQANWDSPFEGESVGSKFEKTGGTAQVVTGITSKGTFQSSQVWGGNRPITLSLVLVLYALKDTQREVMDALRYLEEFASPELNDMAPGGRMPSSIIINIGRNAIYKECIIESISEPYDGEIDSNGRFVRCTVQMQVQTFKMKNRSEIAGTFG